MRLRRDHLLTVEAGFHVAVVVGLLLAALALYRTFGQPLGTAPLTETHPRIVQELENPTPLPTAYDMCLLPGSELWRFAADGHYELHAVENKGQANEVGYTLTFQAATLAGADGPVAIDILARGLPPKVNAEQTMSQQLRDCLKRYKPIDKVTGR